jgi:hypothetical protein
MFDRYAGDNNTQLKPEDKVYRSSKDASKLIIPNLNLMSFLTSVNTPSAPKVLFDSRKYKDICNALATYVTIVEEEIPLTADGKWVEFTKFNDKVMMHESVARLNKGVPNPKERPVVLLPWEIEFTINYIHNSSINSDQIRDIFERGGLHVGLGTFRPHYGKFKVAKWDKAS